MAHDRANDLRALKGFIEQKLSNGAAELAVDDVLFAWELENQTDEECEASLEGIRDGLTDVDAGRTKPFKLFDRAFRSKHGLPFTHELPHRAITAVRGWH
jgi:hypothetical protein